MPCCLKIEQRDAGPLRHRDRLEQEVAGRTSELIKTNAELREAKEKAEAANRAKSEFLVHEPRNPHAHERCHRNDRIGAGHRPHF